MPAILKKQRDGTFRPCWYGDYIEDGKRRVINLNVLVRGTPPASMRVTGNAAFERSRALADAALAKHIEEIRQKGRADHLTERLIESKTGAPVKYYRLSEIAARWRELPRETSPSKAWLTWCDSVFNRFAAHFPTVTFMHEITPEQAGEYRNHLASKFSRKTTRGASQLLKGAFARLLPVGAANPFAGAISRPGPNEDAGTIHRRPFTSDELRALLANARKDEFLFPLVVCAATTGMRRGDVCRLKWSSVDLDAGVLAVKTHKTGANVEIPIFHQLREVLKAQPTRRGYVFPKAALMLEGRKNPAYNPKTDSKEKEFLIKPNPSGLTQRFKRLLAETFPATETEPQPHQASPPARLADVLPAVEKAVCDHLDGTRRDRVLATLRRYATGESVREIGRPPFEGGADHRGQVSMDLHDAERLSSLSFMPHQSSAPNVKATITSVTRTPRNKGCRSASILDWHALRVSWITMALSAGVPIETARLVTGHESVNVVLRHYFKPGREALRSVLLEKMPTLLTGEIAPSQEQGATATPTKPADELAALVGKLADGTATESDKTRFRKLAAKV